MEFLRSLREKIITSAPSYERYDKSSTTTSNILYSRLKIGFSKILYPFSHIEGTNKMFDKRFNMTIYKKFTYFGPRAELLWVLALVLVANKISKNNLERENLDKHFVDRNVFYKLNFRPDTENI